MLALVTATPKPTYSDAPATAKLARKVLKVAFPGVKFSVRSSRYAGGSSVDVTWIDGPLTSEVDAVVGNFHGSDFDGMQDLRTYRKAQHVDGLGLVEFGNDYIFTRRETSPELVAMVSAHVERKYAKGNGFDFEQTVYRIARVSRIVNGNLIGCEPMPAYPGDAMRGACRGSQHHGRG